MSYQFGKSIKQTIVLEEQQQHENKQFIAIGFSQKEKAKNLGAKFDWNEKKWYITTDYNKFMKLFNYKTDEELIKEYEGNIRSNDNKINDKDYYELNKLSKYKKDKLRAENTELHRKIFLAKTKLFNEKTFDDNIIQ